jgi:hypothetical protein
VSRNGIQLYIIVGLDLTSLDFDLNFSVIIRVISYRAPMPEHTRETPAPDTTTEDFLHDFLEAEVAAGWYNSIGLTKRYSKDALHR